MRQKRKKNSLARVEQGMRCVHPHRNGEEREQSNDKLFILLFLPNSGHQQAIVMQERLQV